MPLPILLPPAEPAPAPSLRPRLDALYRALARGDARAVLRHLAPDVEWEHDRAAGGLVLRRTCRRRQVLAALGDPQAPAFASVEIVRLAESGPLAAVLVSTGDRFEMHLWTFDAQGLVRRFRQVAAKPEARTLH